MYNVPLKFKKRLVSTVDSSLSDIVDRKKKKNIYLDFSYKYLDYISFIVIIIMSILGLEK